MHVYFRVLSSSSTIAHSKKELGPGTRMAVKTWAKRFGRQTASITMASGGESSKTFGSSAINTVSLMKMISLVLVCLEMYQRNAM